MKEWRRRDAIAWAMAPAAFGARAPLSSAP